MQIKGFPIKGYRHYKKERAVILSCFGSVKEEERYIALKKYIESEFADADVFLSFSSRTIIKKLQEKSRDVKNMAQTLADADMLGYKKIVVSSINLFPADEHELAQDIVDGFSNFSLSTIRLTPAIFAGIDSAALLHELNTKMKKEDTANLFVFHDTKSKNPSLEYLGQFLKELDPMNLSCSIKGEVSFEALKEEFLNKKIKTVQIIPMLLVSGNHYHNEITAIKKALSSDFEAYIANSLCGSGRFCLLELKSVKDIIKRNIEEEFVRMG